MIILKGSGTRNAYMLLICKFHFEIEPLFFFHRGQYMSMYLVPLPPSGFGKNMEDRMPSGSLPGSLTDIYGGVSICLTYF